MRCHWSLYFSLGMVFRFASAGYGLSLSWPVAMSGIPFFLTLAAGVSFKIQILKETHACSVTRLEFAIPTGQLWDRSKVHSCGNRLTLA